MAWALRSAAAGLAAAALLVRYKADRASRVHPAGGRFVEVGGARLHYVEEGDGPPLVLLHGLGSMVEDFLLSGLVARARDRYRVLVFDRPGYGHSTRPRDRRWTPAAQAALLREALRALRAERPIVLGHSWGALVAVALALQDPAVPRSLVLASGLYFPSVRLDVALLAPPAIPGAGMLLRHTISPLLGRAAWPLWLRMLFHPAPVPPAFEALAWKALRPDTLRAVAEEALQAGPVTAGFARRYAELGLPVVLAAGTQDRYVSARSHTARLAGILPGASVLSSARSGHMVHHSDTALVLQAIDRAASA